MSITDHLIAFAGLSVPPDAAAMMRLSLFDWAACGIAGAAEPDFNGFVATQVAGGQGQCTVLGGGLAAPATAALINGTLSHALDYDDTHFAHIGHPSVAVIPAVLSLAEQTGRDLETLTEAAAIGVEASIAVGLWLGRDHYQIGYHQTATAGAFGATLAASRVLGLTPDQMRHALGLGASMASGIKAQFGTMAKPLNAGLAARTGVEAALWAQSGMTAAQDGLAGALGFGATHHGADAKVDLPVDPWRILGISHKFHACCHGLHAMLEALRGSGLQADDIAALQIRTHPRWMSVCNIPDPDTGLAAKFSYAQTAAMMLTGHDTGAIASYCDAITRDPVITTLRGRIAVSADDSLSETECSLSATLKEGGTRQVHHDLMAPMSFDMRTSKLRAKAAALLGQGRADDLWQAVQGASLGALCAQLVL